MVLVRLFFRFPFFCDACRYLIAAAFVALPATVSAQQHLGSSASNFSELNTVYFNPASLAAPRHSLQINLVSLQTLAANNYYFIESVPALRQNMNADDQDIDDVILRARNNGKSRADIFAEARMPGVMFRIGSNTGVAITTRVRALTTVKGFNTRFLNIAGDGFEVDNDNLVSEMFKNSGLTGQAQAFSELAFSSGFVLLDKDEHRLSGGVSLKWLNGLVAAYADARRLDAEFYDSGIDQRAAMRSMNANLEVGWSSLDGNDLSPRKYLSSNVGIGSDIGVVYERRPVYREMYDENANDFLNEERQYYSWKLSIAFTDLGRIWYTDHAENYRLKSSEVVNWTPDDLASLNLDNFGRVVKDKYDAAVVEENKLVRSLPATINVQGDFRLAPYVYTSATMIGPLSSGPSYYGTVFSIAPRLESRRFEAAFPVSYHSRYKRANIGMTVRMGFLTLGSDDLTGLMQLRTISSTHFYVGFLLNFFPKKDRGSWRPIGSCAAF